MRHLQLTEHFMLKEFAVSSQYPVLAEQITFSYIEAEKFFLICYLLLEPVRERFKAPLKITSGKRTPQLNKLINGSINSQHLRCEAADFEIDGIYLLQIYEWIYHELMGRWRQIIIYYEKDEAQFIHVAIPSLGLDNHPKALIKEEGIYRPYGGVG